MSTGAYGHYFDLFLPPIDVLASLAKVVVFTVLVVLSMVLGLDMLLGAFAAGVLWKVAIAAAATNQGGWATPDQLASRLEIAQGTG